MSVYTTAESIKLDFIETADYLGIHPNDVLKLVASNKLVPRRVDGVLLFSLDNIIEYKSELKLEVSNG